MSKISCFSFFILVILFSSFNPVSAQLKDKFLKGSIVLQNGQTVDGFVQDDELAKMNVHVYFKSSPAEKKRTTYDTSSIKSLTLENGEMYELIHFQGKYMGSSASMLAKLLIKGKASLYQGYYNNDPIFIITNNGNSFVLQNDKLEQGATELTLYDFKIVVHNALFDAALPPNKIEKSSFGEKDFIGLVAAYNQSANAENKIVAVKRKPVHYVIAGAGGMIKNSAEKEIYLHAICRTYFPKISRSTSINVGVNYYKTHYISLNKYNQTDNLINTLVSFPLQVQQNVLNKSFRPFIIAGLDLAYVKEVNAYGVSQLERGFQSNFGIGISYGAGIEADVFKGVMVKSEYRYEVYSHMITLGIAYNFLK